jgi:hypothetical protein
MSSHPSALRLNWMDGEATARPAIDVMDAASVCSGWATRQVAPTTGEG